MLRRGKAAISPCSARSVNQLGKGQRFPHCWCAHAAGVSLARASLGNGPGSLLVEPKMMARAPDGPLQSGGEFLNSALAASQAGANRRSAAVGGRAWEECL